MGTKHVLWESHWCFYGTDTWYSQGRVDISYTEGPLGGPPAAANARLHTNTPTAARMVGAVCVCGGVGWGV